MDSKRLKLLLKILDISWVFMTLVIIATLVFAVSYWLKFDTLSDRFPDHEGFGKIRTALQILPFLAVLPAILICSLFGFILIQMRRIVQSMLVDGVFNMKQVLWIRTLAVWFLRIAAFALVVNVFFCMREFIQGDMPGFYRCLKNFLSLFEFYVLPGLVALGMAEVFIYGTKLKEEQQLTI